MVKAFVLINCELGSENQIISDLRDIECVHGVYGTFGAFDIVADVESDNFEKLRQLIISKIRKINNIRKSMTLMQSNSVN